MTFIPLDSLLSPASDGVNVIINFLLIKKLLMKIENTTIVSEKLLLGLEYNYSNSHSILV